MQDKLATGVLTAIVALVMLLVVSMIAYILFQGIGMLFKPGFLTEAARANGTEGGIFYQLFDSFYMLFLTLIISVPIELGRCGVSGRVRAGRTHYHHRLHGDRDPLQPSLHRRGHVRLPGVFC